MEYTQEQLNQLNQQLNARIGDLLQLFNICPIKSHNTIIGKCPIHDGDNPKSLYINTEYGSWKCWTSNCHLTHKQNIIGLVRGILNKEKFTSFSSTIRFCENFLGNPIGKAEFVAETGLTAYDKWANRIKPAPQFNIHFNEIKNRYAGPSQYYLDRGFTKEVLEKYLIGDCRTTGKYFNGRAVIPIFDNNHAVAFSGRSLYEKCPDCKFYHNTINLCPSEDYRYIFSKWRHSEKFAKEYYLFNYDNARPFIEKSTSAILVESPNNVLRLEECGIHNSLGMFGCYLSGQQKDLLDMAGCLSLIVILDNDKAGLSGRKSIIDLCGLTHNICFLTPTKNDIADMTVKEVKDFLKGHI